MDVSIILATCKRPVLLAQTLTSFTRLQSKGISWEILVIDNADSPETRSVTAEFASRLPSLRLRVETTPGKNHALNLAVRHARGEFFLFTDDDVRVEPGWLQAMWAGARRWPGYSVFGGRIKVEFPDENVPLAKGDRYYRAAYADADWNAEEGPYAAAKVFGPNMAVRAEVFRAGWSFGPDLGPSGSNYIMGGETDFVERLERAGLEAVFLPESVVWHRVRPEQLTSAWLHRRAFCFGRMLAYCGTGPKPLFLYGLPLRLLWKRAMLLLPRSTSFSRRRRLLAEMDDWKLKGMMYQYREGKHAAAG